MPERWTDPISGVDASFSFPTPRLVISYLGMMSRLHLVPFRMFAVISRSEHYRFRIALQHARLALGQV